MPARTGQQYIEGVKERPPLFICRVNGSRIPQARRVLAAGSNPGSNVRPAT
ncbi:MAG: hypothetical protein Ct9H300mP11_13770 [Chloroflexota bacterium]|nr:MAG: hypothetical protein Ct9H300mP11_13770 [Chloroflexota bacterium]